MYRGARTLIVKRMCLHGGISGLFRSRYFKRLIILLPFIESAVLGAVYFDV